MSGATDSSGDRRRHLIAVHVGSVSPDHWDEIEADQVRFAQTGMASPHLLKQVRPPLAYPEVDWARHDLAPRWVGDEATSCAASLGPSPYHRQGAQEHERFLAGAASRGELALILAFAGSPARSPAVQLPPGVEDSLDVRSVFDDSEPSVPLIGHKGFVSVRHPGDGVQPRLVEGLNAADKDLGLRLVDISAIKWRTLALDGYSVSNGYERPQQVNPDGLLMPLLESEIGEPIVAVWISPDESQRMYILPVTTPVDVLLGWLRDRALAEFVPDALRRIRDPDVLGEDYPTARESDLRTRMAVLDAEYETSHAALVRELSEEIAATDVIRHDLVFGTGRALEQAVASVLRAAMIKVDLADDLLGATANADLVATYAGHRRLVEVKSASKAASETLYDALISHLREWPATGQPAVGGGALVVSHEQRKDPRERSPQVYSRQAFLDAQVHPVLSCMDLLDAWRLQDWPRLRALVFGKDLTGESGDVGAQAEHDAAPDAPVSSASDDVGPRRRRRWFGR